MLTRNKRKLLENEEVPEIKRYKKSKHIQIEEDSFKLETVFPPKVDIFEEIDKEEEESEESDEDEKFNLEEWLNKFQKNDKEVYQNFMEVSELLQNLEPNILEILKAPIKLKDKAKLVELYEIYKNTEMPSEEGIKLRDNIKNLLKKYKQSYAEFSLYSPEKVKALKEESKRIKSCRPKLDLKSQILTLETSPENKLAIYKKYKDMEELNEQDEANKLKTWLKWSLAIPHDRVKENTFENESISSVLNRVKQSLDKELYGMNNVKEQLLIFLNSKLQNKNMKGCSIGLMGAPGCGKTSIAKVLSKCLNFPFEQISFGGVSDPEFLTGHDYTYIGSRPGEIVRCLSRMKYKNGIIFLDEFEKVSSKKGITSTLLHLTDFTQNNEFRDNYLADITIDLSNIWFIYSMNNLPEDAALRDRLFVINVDGYSVKDKVKIVKDYLLPRAIKNIGRNEGDITISEETSFYLVNKVDKQRENTGVRTLEKCIKDMVNKIHFLVSNKKEGLLQIGFNIGFDVGYIKQYPVEIKRECIDKLVEEEKRNDVYLGMFI